MDYSESIKTRPLALLFHFHSCHHLTHSTHSTHSSHPSHSSHQLSQHLEHLERLEDTETQFYPFSYSFEHPGHSLHQQQSHRRLPSQALETLSPSSFSSRSACTSPLCSALPLPPSTATALTNNHSRILDSYPTSTMSYAYDSFSFDDESSASCCPSSPSLAPCTPITMVGDLGFGIGSESPVVVPHPRFFIPSGGSEGIRSVPVSLSTHHPVLP